MKRTRTADHGSGFTDGGLAQTCAFDWWSESGLLFYTRRSILKEE
ncbi:hypothetical protein QOZ95_001044 [Paenibacillus brasilensis]|uniref:Uncharacterized protein n=1 Tax=Paenibacillus brasilensis TaxID=128574 RepID=A0ABU0KXS4_9BACL|nr:hypothetical protein [Paenibacillus brasilensis]